MDTNSQSPTPLDKDSKKKKGIILLFAAFSVFCLCICFAIIFVFPNFDFGDLGQIGTVSNIYSKDQKKFIDEFGLPDSYNITIDNEFEEQTRIEVWKYVDIDEIFTFNDGEFIGRKHYYFDDVDGVEVYSLNLEPKDFYDVETREDLDRILGTAPSATTTIDESILGGGTKYYEYGIWLHAAELDGTIVSIDQKAFTEKAEKPTSEINNAEVGAGDDQEQDIFMNEKYSFTFKVGNNKDKIIEKHDEVDWALDSYDYCYKTDDAMENSICGTEGIPLFTISIMNRKQYTENVMNAPDTEFIDMDMTSEGVDEEGFNLNEKFYEISFPNGDIGADSIPEELSRANILKSFYVPGGTFPGLT
ncbi:hypothetical protein GF362_00885 [Candidatus Dojkabacteria bacterium]|nr:hypothetical protein [Candidatus Dojkabacteria bacterium]